MPIDAKAAILSIADHFEEQYQRLYDPCRFVLERLEAAKDPLTLITMAVAARDGRLAVTALLIVTERSLVLVNLDSREVRLTQRRVTGYRFHFVRADRFERVDVSIAGESAVVDLSFAHRLTELGRAVEGTFKCEAWLKQLMEAVPVNA
jgi:hypothetical protein